MTPLLIATDGYLPNPTPLSIAVRGYLGGVIARDYSMAGLTASQPIRRAKDLTRREKIQREEDEILTIIIESIISGIIN